jgi:ATP-dependent Clp protease ATP-binding subunit ClpB
MPEKQSSTLTLDNLIPEAKSLVVDGQNLADKYKHRIFDTLHFLAAMLNHPKVAAVFKLASVDANEVKAVVETELHALPQGSDPAFMSAAMVAVLAKAEKEAGDSLVGIDHLLNAMTLEIKGGAAKVLNVFNIGPGSLRPHTEMIAVSPSKKEAKTPIDLIDLTSQAKAKKLDPVIGMEAEVRRLIQMLGRKNKNHCLLVGEDGVGRQSIVNSLSTRIALGYVPDHLKSASVYQLNLSRLIAGGKVRGEAEEKIKEVFNSLKGKNAVLFIHSLEALLSGNSLMNGVSGVLSSILPTTQVRLIASTTPEGMRKLTEKDAYLVKNFTSLTVEQPSQEQAIQVLRGIAVKYEKHHEVKIGDPAITAAVKLAKRHMQNRSLPQSAVDLLDEAASRKRMELDGICPKLDHAINRLDSVRAQLAGLKGDTDPMSLKTISALDAEVKELTPVVSEGIKKLHELEGEKKGQDTSLTDEDIAFIVSDTTGIPLSKMVESDSEKYGKLEERLSARVIGQEEAVKAVSKAIRRSKSGLRDVRKPIGSFLFLGSSGVGKTLLAKALASTLFDDEEAMIRIDCAELAERHQISRLLGSPQGYQDSEAGGQLTEAVKKKPYSVLLFDEIEKAHPDIFNVLLSALDDGVVHDSRGRRFDFCNTIVIMTTNIGSKDILETPAHILSSPEGMEELRIHLRKKLTEFLRVEFLNRIDDQIVFSPISKSSLKSVVDLEIKAIEKLLSDKDIKLNLTNDVKEFLSSISWEPAMGARPLKRSILKRIQDPLAEQMMSGKLGYGSKVQISMEGEELKFHSS